MPWIDQESCTGCGICVEKCPVDAISLSVFSDTQSREQAAMNVETVAINMATCIRCGTCHDVCQYGSVRHDSEKIPDLVKSNVEMTKRNMALCAKFLGSDKERDKCLNRMIKYFNREKVIAEKTLEALGQLADVNDSGG
jgi:ferredoxin